MALNEHNPFLPVTIVAIVFSRRRTMTEKKNFTLNKQSVVFLLFILAGLFLLWNEHKVHIMGALPYLILLICPLMHIFLHSGHGDNSSNHDENTSQNGGTS